MEIGALIIAAGAVAVLGIVAGVGLGRYVWPSLAQAQAEIARRDQECRDLCSNVEGLNIRYTAADERARAAERQVSALTERERNLSDKLSTQALQLAALQKQLTTEFENIATRILKSNTDQLSEQSKAALTEVVTPLQNKIKEFQENVEKTYGEEKREVLSLKAQIDLIHNTSQQVGNQADSLAKALRGDSQLLGRWGELALERILQAAGLEEGREYIKQGKDLNLKSEDGRRQKPDFVVMLPDKRSFVIDSKANLASYDQMIAATDDAVREQYEKQLVEDLKLNVRDLFEDHYQGNPTLDAHEAVLMFVPIEGALATALKKDPSLLTYAWDCRVVLVGPSTLLMTMRTVASIWQYQEQRQKAHEIADLASRICNKFIASTEDLNAIREVIADALNKALETHDAAMKRLFSGQGNALSLLRRLEELKVDMKGIPSVATGDGPLAPAENEEGSEEGRATQPIIVPPDATNQIPAVDEGGGSS